MPQIVKGRCRMNRLLVRPVTKKFGLWLAGICLRISRWNALYPPANFLPFQTWRVACRAASYLDLKEPEPAAAAATQSLHLARRTGAPRCVRLVEDLLPRFYPRAQGVAELLQLTAA
ncbi:hypothetical protein ACH49O_40745 [Streptomyces coeruleorubidus]|uniref:hypothetical protein n=1 Tax=Streptomyces coeruleorubidus TaxID=116188 RepID=UPI003405685A